MPDDRQPDNRLGRAGERAVRRRAEKYAKDPARAQKLLDDAMAKANLKKGRLAGVWDAFMAMFRLVRAWATGKYKRAPTQTIVKAIAAILYFLMPFDLIPDWLLAIGLIDDAAVIVWVLKAIRTDLEKFRQWEAEQAESEQTRGEQSDDEQTKGESAPGN